MAAVPSGAAEPDGPPVPRLVGTAAALLVGLSWSNTTTAVLGAGLVGPPWWAAPLLLALLVAQAALVGASLLGRRPAVPALAVLTLTMVTLVSGLVLHAAGLTEPPLRSVRTWTWHLDLPYVVAVSLLVLRWPAARALTTLALCALTLVGLRSRLPFSAASASLDVADGAFLLALSTTVYAGFSAVHEASSRLGSARGEAATSEASADAAEAAEADHARWEALVHDDVLTALTVARGSAGSTGAARTADAAVAARAALQRIAAEPRGGDAALPDLRRRLVEATREADPAAVVQVTEHGGGRVPGHVADALVDATSELVRNAARHAGAGGAATITGTLSASAALVVVRDEGVGFDATSVAADRLGLRVSVRQRLTAAGGRATITSAPGTGTRAELRWPAPEADPEAQ